MSRIHDALKKAAEERAVHNARISSKDAFEIAKEIREPVPAAEELRTVQSNVAQGSGARPPVFEDLLKRCAHHRWDSGRLSDVFENHETKMAGAECFRVLRSRVYSIAGTRTLKRILVTSSIPGEGKTFVAANLARSIIRQPERRVLLIDADLRVPCLHLLFGAPSKPGLSDYLRGEVDEYGIIQSGPIENLCIIPAGSETPDPSELLLKDRMKGLLDFATPIFDFIILDSPPVIPVHDASSLADLSDGTLFVVRAGATDHEVAAKAAAEFKNKRALGVVLNCAGSEVIYGRSYGGY